MSPAAQSVGAPASDARPRPSVWLHSPAFDLGLVLGPAFLAVLLAALLPLDAVLSPVQWLLVVVFVDVAHVYASLYRTVLDPGAWAARRGLFVGVGLACLAGLLALYGALGMLGFWRVLAYLAVFHFVRQVVGFASLYRLREGRSTRSLEARVERGALYGLTLWPLLWWHVHGPLAFEWFVEDDFLVGLPAWTLWPAGLLAGGLLLAHLGLRLQSRRAAWGRDLWLLLTGLVWVGGIVLMGSDAAFTLTNVVAHGLPYLALVLLVGHRQWTLDGSGPLSARWYRGPLVVLLVLPLLLLAVAEEALWDWAVWREHAVIFGEISVPALLSALAVPLLAWPQVVHYVLDGFIWKLDGSNGGLRRWLAGGPPRRSEVPGEGLAPGRRGVQGREATA